MNVVHHRSPLLLLPKTDDELKQKTALIILNANLGETPSPLLQRLWELADTRICADGGANRLWGLQRPDWIPNAIVGDLDSVQPTVRAFYESAGVSILHRPDQDYNDFDKALTVAIHDANCQSCIVFGAFGGRFDQEMGCLQALYKWGASSSSTTIWLYDDYTMAFLLPANVENHIELALGTTASVVGEGPTCGLIPLGAPCESVTTTGFQWDLTGQPTHFGGLVSTSNRIVELTATVTASSPLIFTAEIHSGRTSKD